MDIPFFKSLSLGGSALFKHREKGIVGIDLGSSSLKLVQLRKEKERAILETYGEISTAHYGGVEMGQSARLVDQKVLEMLEDLIKEANITARQAVVSLPLRVSFVSLLTLPIMNEKDLAEAVHYEARRYIPVPINEVILDWWSLPQGILSDAEREEGLVKEKKFIEVLLVAVHQQVLEKYRSIFKEAGIEIVSFEIEIFSQVRSAIAREVAPILLIDYGAQSTRFTIVDYNIVRMSHNADRGSQDLTLALSRSLGIDFERAEKLKRDTGLSLRPEHQEIKNVIEPLLDHNFSEGIRVMTEYKRRTNHSIKRIVFTGGGSLLKGLIDFSINKFGVEARLSNPFQKVEYPPFLEPALRDLSPIFSTALGLALREMQK